MVIALIIISNRYKTDRPAFKSVLKQLVYTGILDFKRDRD